MRGSADIWRMHPDRLVCNNGISGITHNGILLMNVDGSKRRMLLDDSERSAKAPV
jgi:hypothetical protein